MQLPPTGLRGGRLLEGESGGRVYEWALRDTNLDEEYRDDRGQQLQRCSSYGAHVIDHATLKRDN